MTNQSYLLAEVMGRKSRSILMVSGLALGVALWLCLNAVSGAYGQAAAVPLRELGADLIVQKSGGPVPNKFEGAVLPCADAAISGRAASRIKTLPGVQEVASALVLWAFDSGMKNAGDFKMVLGIDPSSRFGPGKLKEGVRAGRFLKAGTEGEALLDETYAAAKGLKPGDTITVAARKFHVAGVVAAPPSGLLGTINVYIPLEDAQEIASQATQISGFKREDLNLLFIRIDPASLAGVQQGITAALPGVTVSTPGSFLALMGGIAAAAKRLALLGTSIALLAALAISVRTSAGVIWERRHDIAMMKAVGWATADVRRQVISENLVLGFLGGLLGLAAAFCFTLALRGQVVNIPLPWELDPYPHFYLTTSAAKSLSVPLPIHLTWGAVILGLVSGMALSLLTTILVGRRLAHIKPAEVLRYE